MCDILKKDEYSFAMRAALFQELPNDVIVEISDVHGVPPERVLFQKHHTLAEDELLEEEEVAEAEKDRGKSKNWDRLRKFLESGQHCCANDCLQHFDEKALMQFAHSLDNCSKSEAEAALLMNMLEHGDTSNTSKGDKPLDRQSVRYIIPSLGSMCREAYLLLWGKGRGTLCDLREYQKESPWTFAPRVHGNVTKKSNHALSSSLYREVVFFIKKIGKEAGEESEGRHLKRENRAVKRGVVYFLPAFYSVALLYRLFIAHYQEKYKLAKNKPPPLSLRQFYYIFQSPECECVQLRSPRSDVCDVCLLYRSRIRRDTGIVDENDEEEVSAWNEHVTRAKEARNVYRDEIKAAQQGFKDFLAGHKKAEEYIPHATFDFAQNLGLPQLSDEPQEIYFASQRSIYLFSIRDDGPGIQYNFLYDEGDGGKGGNYVASMLVLFLLDLSSQFKPRCVFLNADNCCAQNKNNIVLWILNMLVILGIFDHIELKFLEKGHSHCTVDGGHGLIKKEWRKRNVFSIEQVKQIIEECSDMQRAIILSPKEFFDWASLLGQYFLKLPGISYQREFKFHKEQFGVVHYRSSHGQKWQTYQLFQNKDIKLPKELSSVGSIRKHLKIMEPPGVPLKKQWNLFKKVRKYVPDGLKDVLCPEPNEPESFDNDEAN